jgi:hypothetical protein
MHQKFREKYHLMTLSDMIFERTLGQDYGDVFLDLMMTLDLQDWVYSLLKRKWPDGEVQKEKLKISKSIYELFRNEEDDYYSEMYMQDTDNEFYDSIHNKCN